MAKAHLFDARSGERSDLNLSGPLFETDPKEHVIHRAVVAELDARRRFTASTKGRKEIVGSGRKLYRQKGTGRARAGDIKPPNRIGGGTWGGPKPKGGCSHKRINDKPSTRQARDLILGMELEGPILVVITEDDRHAALSFRNLPKVTVVGPYEYGVYELLRAREVVFSRAAYERLAGERRNESGEDNG